MAALHLAVVPRSIWTNELVANSQRRSRLFKQRRQVAFAVGKTVGKLKAVVCLDAFDLDTPALIPFCQLAEKVRRGVGGLLRVSSEEAQACELVDGGVLKQM